MRVNPLRAHLEAISETETAFAARAGLSQSFLSRLISGEREADASLLARFEDVSGGAVTPSAWVRWWRTRPVQEESV